MPTFGPLVAYLPTPRTAEGRVALDVLADDVDRVVAAGVHGVAVLGSTGGAAYLDARERAVVVAEAAAALDGRAPLMAGIGALTTRDALAHAEAATAAGADALLLAPTTYLPLTPAEVTSLYRDVAGRAGRPVWVYHNPVTTGVALGVEQLLDLVALPGVGGCKDRGPDAAVVDARARTLVAGAPEHVEVGFSGDLLGVHGLLAGARTWHSGVASVLPGPYVRAAEAAAAGDAEAALGVVDEVRPVVELVLAHGGPRVVHALAELLGLRAGRLPAPLEPPSSEVVDALADALSPALLPASRR